MTNKEYGRMDCTAPRMATPRAPGRGRRAFAESAFPGWLAISHIAHDVKPDLFEHWACLRGWARFSALAVFALFWTGDLRAGGPDSPDAAAAIRHYNLSADKVALGGYDPVAYFTKNQALKGRKEISAQHRGVTYRFDSEADRKLFAGSPEKYLPAYGGWCATAMAKAEKVEIDPANFKLTNGRLFLFYKGLWGNALKDWEKDEAGLAARADANWKKIAGE